MQLGSVISVFQQPHTAIGQDADEHPTKKKRISEASDAMDAPLAAYMQVVVQRQDNAYLHRGLTATQEQWSGRTPTGRKLSDPLKPQRQYHHADWPVAPLKSLREPVIAPVLSTAVPEPATVVKKNTEHQVTQPNAPAVNAEMQAQGLTMASPEPQSTGALPRVVVSTVVDDGTALSNRPAEDETATERRRPEPAVASLPRHMAGMPDGVPSGGKSVALAEPASRREFRSPEMLHHTAQNTVPLANGETRISWTFRRWQPAGDQGVRISLLPDAASQMVMTPSTREVGERLELARFAEGAPDFVLRDERGHEQNSRHGQREQQEEDEV